jgi:hypothetical protein
MTPAKCAFNVVGLVIVLTASSAIFAARPVRADAPAPHARTARFEINFLKDMIDHHMMAVEMGEICVHRAIHDELHGLCHEIIDAQTAEIEMMQDWLHDWYGFSYQPHMTGKDRNQLRALSRLHGRRFEIRFMMGQPASIN